MAGLPQTTDPNLLVGYSTSDDAGIYRLTDEIAIITTADFITPPVDDPYQFGQIAAANALSDVWAMGGRPVSCLNLVAFPSKKLPRESLNGIIAGALNKITEAGAVLAGGHSIDDDEPKFGLAVTGVVHPKKYWTNSAAQPGDTLILTKPVGSGVLFNANIKHLVSVDAMNECIHTISTLNKAAAEILLKYTVHAATDITGFGLAGHCLEMAKGSKKVLEIRTHALPIMNEAFRMYQKGVTTGTNAFNRKMVSAHTRLDVSLPLWHEEILYDPQTSGGLLVALPETEAHKAVDELRNEGVVDATIIGRVMELSPSEATYLVFK